MKPIALKKVCFNSNIKPVLVAGFPFHDSTFPSSPAASLGVTMYAVNGGVFFEGPRGSSFVPYGAVTGVEPKDGSTGPIDFTDPGAPKKRMSKEREDGRNKSISVLSGD